MSQIGGINLVGFGDVAERLGKISGLFRVNDGDRLFRIQEKAEEGPLIASGSFDYDQLNECERFECFQQLLVSCQRVGEG